MFRNIYEQSYSPKQALIKLDKWYEKVEKHGYKPLITAAYSIKCHQATILNFFKYRRTNALAENFNSKIKAFRRVFRGVRDIAFFIYRVALIYA